MRVHALGMRGIVGRTMVARAPLDSRAAPPRTSPREGSVGADKC